MSARRVAAFLDEVLDRALEMIHSQDELLFEQKLFEQKEDIAAKIDRAYAQADRAEIYTDEESRADMARRKAEWQSDRQNERP